MDLSNITLAKFVEKCTYASNPNPQGKIVMSNGAFVQCLVMLKIEIQLKRLVGK